MVTTGSSWNGSPTTRHFFALIKAPRAVGGVACPASSISKLPINAVLLKPKSLEKDAKVELITGTIKNNPENISSWVLAQLCRYIFLSSSIL